VSFEQFIKERQYLHNVSPRTIEWYRESFRWLGTEIPTEGDLKAFVVRIREKGLKPTSCNNRIRAINSYLRWSGSTLKMRRLREEQRVLPTFSVSDISRLAHWKPMGFYQSRLHTLVVTLIDTGCRVNEVLSLRGSDCDFDNLLLTVRGKGKKERKIPMSLELRRFLWKHGQYTCGDLVFSTKDGRKLG
jgi:integrase/recombinase XerD